jgi:hypothetical protein
MKTFIALILLCGSAFGADTSIQVVTTVKTNAETASIYTMDVFTRDGQTNLVRRIKTKTGVEQIRIQQFYYHGLLVGDFVAMPESSGFTTEAGSPYSVSFEFWASKDIRSAVIGTKDGVVLDAFMATNGLFYPADISVIQRANYIGGDVSKLLSPANVTNTTPGEFRNEVEQLIEKHKDK